MRNSKGTIKESIEPGEPITADWHKDYIRPDAVRRASLSGAAPPPSQPLGPAAHAVGVGLRISGAWAQCQPSTPDGTRQTVCSRSWPGRRRPRAQMRATRDRIVFSCARASRPLSKDRTRAGQYPHLGRYRYRHCRAFVDGWSQGGRSRITHTLSKSHFMPSFRSLPENSE